MQTILIFLFVIVVLVVAHELGHFLVAKLFGVKVEEFGIGYPPRAKKLFTKGGTLFTLNWLPFGGFVKIFGEQNGENLDKNSFANQKLWKRLSIIIAGVVANMILAMLLFGFSFTSGFLGNAEDFKGAKILSEPRITITDIQKDSPASNAGFKTGDSLLTLSSGTEKNTPADIVDVITFIKMHGDKPVNISILRKDTIRTLEVTPTVGVTGNAPGIGISLTSAQKLRLPFFTAMAFGAEYAVKEFKIIVVTRGSLLSGAVGGDNTLVSQISGPVGIAQYAGTAFGMGIGSFLFFMALISVNLAVINLFPFPALDGGRFILEFFSYGGRSRINLKVVSVINQVGFLLLIAIMLYATYHDIAKLVT
jgi:regulator of sigma E protease